ncbi:MAG: GNAT family N-acetyltransferase [Candidatus Micrarchaeota archaeon]
MSPAWRMRRAEQKGAKLREFGRIESPFKGHVNLTPASKAAEGILLRAKEGEGKKYVWGKIDPGKERVMLPTRVPFYVEANAKKLAEHGFQQVRIGEVMLKINPEKREAHITDVYPFKNLVGSGYPPVELQRKGIGDQTLNETLNWLKKKGFRTIKVNDIRPDAEKMFKKHGFKPDKTSDKYGALIFHI